MTNPIFQTTLNGIRSLWSDQKEELALPALRPTLAVLLTWVAAMLTWAGLVMCAIVLAVGAVTLLPAIGRDLRSDLQAQEAEQRELQRQRKARREHASASDQWHLAGGHVIQLVPLDGRPHLSSTVERESEVPATCLPKRGLNPVVVHGVFIDDRRAA